jgi:N-carbamoylputrescine amidase
MRVTVCELNDAPDAFALEWEQLVAHVKVESSQLVLLPEMPFCPWFAVTDQFDAAVWQQAVATHDSWLARLIELAPAVVLGSRPMNEAGRRFNQGFVWDQSAGYRAAHLKYYLPNEDGFWEASWYERGDGRFIPINCGAVRIGFQICTDLWFMERSRAYGKAGVHLIVNPRATARPTLDKWLVGGRAAAIVAGAYCLSSNRVSDDATVAFGGQGWIVGPDGEVLGLTSPEQPFVSIEIDLAEAEQAKSTYPRYVAE